MVWKCSFFPQPFLFSIKCHLCFLASLSLSLGRRCGLARRSYLLDDTNTVKKNVFYPCSRRISVYQHKEIGEKFWHTSSFFWIHYNNCNKRVVHLNRVTQAQPAALPLIMDQKNQPGKSEAGMEANNQRGTRINSMASSVSKGHHRDCLISGGGALSSDLWSPSTPISHDDVDDDRCAWGAGGGRDYTIWIHDERSHLA